jgi:beta-propeller repeat-containing protein
MVNGRMCRVVLVTLAVVTYRLSAPAAQTPEQPHAPVVRYSREISQPRGTIVAAIADAGGNIYVTGYTSGGLQTRSEIGALDPEDS